MPNFTQMLLHRLSDAYEKKMVECFALCGYGFKLVITVRLFPFILIKFWKCPNC